MGTFLGPAGCLLKLEPRVAGNDLVSQMGTPCGWAAYSLRPGSLNSVAYFGNIRLEQNGLLNRRVATQ